MVWRITLTYCLISPLIVNFNIILSFKFLFEFIYFNSMPLYIYYKRKFIYPHIFIIILKISELIDTFICIHSKLRIKKIIDAWINLSIPEFHVFFFIRRLLLTLIKLSYNHLKLNNPSYRLPSRSVIMGVIITPPPFNHIINNGMINRPHLCSNWGPLIDWWKTLVN